MTDLLDPRVADWLRGRTQAVLTTIRADGSPQTSNVLFAWDGRVADVSITTTRAKTANMRRDPRVVLHVLGDTFWQYAAVACHASLGPVSTEVGDEAGRSLLSLYERAGGRPHPDPDEFLTAMVRERRLMATLTPVSAVTVGIEV